MKRIRGDGVRLAKLNGATEPKWNMVMPYGTKFRPDFTGGRWDFDRAKAAVMVANFRKLKERYKGEDSFGLQVNYHHLGGAALESGAPLPSTVAGGWIEDLEARADGMWGLTRWTKAAAAMIDADEFRYFSPEWCEDARDRDTGQPQGPTLIGGALTNVPLFSEMPRLAATDVQPEAASAAQEGAKHMEKKLLCARLGLPETATDQEIAAKLDELKTAAAQAKDEADAKVKLGEVNGKLEKLSELVTASTQRVATLEAENKALKASEQAREVKAFVDGLVTAGKIVPAQHEEVTKLATADLKLAQAVYAKAPRVVELGENGSGGGAGGNGSDVTPEAAVEQLRAATDKIAAEKKVSLAIARDMAIRENPELARKSWRSTSSSRPSRA